MSRRQPAIEPKLRRPQRPRDGRSPRRPQGTRERGCGWTPRRVHGERPVDGRYELPGKIRTHGRERGGARLDLLPHLHRRGLPERMAAGKRFPEEDADRPDICRRPRALALEPLGRNVGKRARNVAHGGQRLGVRRAAPGRSRTGEPRRRLRPRAARWTASRHDGRSRARARARVPRGPGPLLRRRLRRRALRYAGRVAMYAPGRIRTGCKRDVHRSQSRMPADNGGGGAGQPNEPLARPWTPLCPPCR